MLRSYKLGEADRIVVFFGRESGQFRAVAKGVRRTASKFGARLGSFNLVDVQCHRGKGLHTVTQVETITAYAAHLADSYDAFTNAKLMVELTQKLTAEQEGELPHQHAELFDLLHGALNAISGGERPPSLLASSYLLRAMALQGWQAQLGECSSCYERGPHSGFSVVAGGAVCPACSDSSTRRTDPNVLELARLLQEGSWNEVTNFSPNLWGDVADLAGEWAQWQIEQRLRSLKFATSTRTISNRGGRQNATGTG